MKKNLHVFVWLIFIAPVLQAQPISRTILFNDDWAFHRGDFPGAEKEEVVNSMWRRLTLPHDWGIEGPFSNEWASGTGFLPGGIAWYKKLFSLDNVQPGDKVFIYFDGVYKNSEVWLNGQSLGKRPNGYIPF